MNDNKFIVWVSVDLEIKKWLDDKKRNMPKGRRSVNQVMLNLVRDAMLNEQTFEEQKSVEAQEEFKN